MNEVIKVCNMNKTEDVNRIRKAISSNEGVVACQINKEKGEVSVVFDSYFVNIEQIIQSIEDLGYTVL
ncbi:MAG TPA: ferredoxin [Clostridium sp.]|jgi:copper chaperone|nr:heavy-metal-associated domain-containing protein [Clostridia bacterium]HCW03069.1 ferredoxin [Clostridium sp.]